MTQVRFTPAVPVLTYERVVEQIEQAIVSGEVPAGAHLPSERELMVQFSVSRPTVREALRVLQSRGLIASRPGARSGPEVLPFTGAALQHSFTTLARVAALSLPELVQFRVILETSACRLAATLRTPAQLAAMCEAVDRMEACAERRTDDGPAEGGADPRGAGDVGCPDFSAADLDFHAAIWRASHNELLRVSGEAVSGAVLALMRERLAGARDPQQAMRDSAASDRLLLEAIAAGDSAGAGERARASITASFADYLDEEGRRGLAAL